MFIQKLGRLGQPYLQKVRRLPHTLHTPRVSSEIFVCDSDSSCSWRSCDKSGFIELSWFNTLQHFDLLAQNEVKRRLPKTLQLCGQQWNDLFINLFESAILWQSQDSKGIEGLGQGLVRWSYHKDTFLADAWLDATAGSTGQYGTIKQRFFPGIWSGKSKWAELLTGWCLPQYRIIHKSIWVGPGSGLCKDEIEWSLKPMAERNILPPQWTEVKCVVYAQPSHRSG